MKARIASIWLAITILIQGCAKSPESIESHQNRAQTPSIPVSSEATDYFVTSTTPNIRSTPIGTNFPAVTKEAVYPIRRTCIATRSPLPVETIYPGKLILLGALNLDDIQHPYQDLIFYDLNTHQTTPATPDKAFSIDVSPDRMKYAVGDVVDGRIKVFTNDGQLITTLAQSEHPLFISQWLENEHLALVVHEQLEGIYYFKYPRDIVIADLTTDKQNFLPSNYPDIDEAQPNVPWEGISTTKYDPQLSRVVYLGVIESDFQGNRGQGYVLWDMVKNEKLVQLVLRDFTATPKWSPDGSKFVINDIDFYLVTRDGAVSQISPQLDQPLNQPAEIWNFSRRYSWSPDGQYLAYWREFTQQGIHQGTFAILDTHTEVITDYCLSAGYVERGTPSLTPYFTPIWSPDGKSVVTIANRKENGDFDVVLFDLQEKTVFKIIENMIPEGWLINSENQSPN